MITPRDRKCTQWGIIQTAAQKEELILLHDSLRQEMSWGGRQSFFGNINQQQTNPGKGNSMPTKKKTAKVRDLKPSKDAKGGGRKRNLDGRTTAGRTTAGRTTAGRTVQ